MVHFEGLEVYCRLVLHMSYFVSVVFKLKELNLKNQKNLISKHKRSLGGWDTMTREKVLTCNDFVSMCFSGLFNISFYLSALFIVYSCIIIIIIIILI